MTDTVLTLCAPCLGEAAQPAADTLRAALDAAGVAARVETGACLGPCDAPAALALQGRGAVYVFAGVRPGEDEADIVATCRAHDASPAGWITDARPCGRLRFCLRARIPAPS